MDLQIPYPQEGTYVVGGTGTRKSTLLLHRMLHDREAGRGFVLIDPKGDLAERVATHVPDAVVLDVDAANFGLDLFACHDPGDAREVERVVDRVMQVFGKVFGLSREGTARLNQYLRNSAKVLIANRGKMGDLPRLLLDKPYRDGLLGNVRDGDCLAFWGYHDGLPPNEKKSHIESTYDRVDAYLGGVRGRTIFSGEQSVDWVEVMDAGRVVLVRLDPDLAELSSLVGATVMGQLAPAAFGRRQRQSWGIYADEYHRFAIGATNELLTMGRGFGIAMTVAHQTRTQLDEETKGATLQVANVVVFRVSPGDAEVLAGLFDTSPPEPEVRGTEPVRAPTPRVVEELLRNGYGDAEDVEDRWARDFVNLGLRPLQEHIDTPRLKGHHNFRVNGRTYLTSKEALREGVRRIDDFLRLANEGDLPTGSLEMTERLVAIFVPLRAYFGLAEESRLPDALLDFGIDDWQVRTLREHEEELQTPVPVEFPEEARQGLANWMTQTQFNHWVGSRYDEFVGLLLTNPNWTNQGFVRGLPTQTVRETTGFAWNLLKLAGILKRKPILTATGRFVETKERPRSRDDVRSQIANELANLPTGVARIRIRTETGFRYGEYAVPFPPPDGLYPRHGHAPTPPRVRPPVAAVDEPVVDEEDVSPRWHWETALKRQRSRPEPPRGRGWHWEAAPGTRLRDRVQEGRPPAPRPVFEEAEALPPPPKEKPKPPPSFS